MKLLIDDAHIELIKHIYEFYPVDGVTTNPTILANSGRKPYDVLHEIRAFIGTEAQLHVQAVAGEAALMVKEASHAHNQVPVVLRMLLRVKQRLPADYVKLHMVTVQTVKEGTQKSNQFLLIFFFVQAVAGEAALMVKEAQRIVKELGANTYVKIPAVPEGFKAMKELAELGIPFTATAVYTPMSCLCLHPSVPGNPRQKLQPQM